MLFFLPVTLHFDNNRSIAGCCVFIFLLKGPATIKTNKQGNKQTRQSENKEDIVCTNNTKADDVRLEGSTTQLAFVITRVVQRRCCI